MDYPDYNPQSPVTPLTADELQQLDSLLQHLPADAAMTLDGMDGFLTALLVGPPELLSTLTTAGWLPQVWGGDHGDDAAPFNSKRQRKATTVQLLRHLRHISAQLATAPEAWEPIFSVAEQGADEWVDARDWCTGFLQAVDLLPGAWAPLWDDDSVAGALAPLLLLGGGLQGDAPTSERDALDEQAVDELSRAVPDAVLVLATRRAGLVGEAP